jgi:effector-binding domain-containing protein
MENGDAMLSEPRVDNRDEQAYAAIRTKVSMPELPAVIPQLLGEVFAWLGKQGMPPAGPPLIRYNVINMPGQMDIDLGVPVASTVTGDGRVTANVLPAGRYASLIYTGTYEGPGLMQANAALLEWGAKQGLVWDSWNTPDGEAFGARFESYLTDPAAEPDPAKYETQVCFRLKD